MFSATPSKADIKLIRSLSQKKFRESTGLFVVEGEKMVEEALHRSSLEAVAVYRSSEIGEEAMSRMTQLSSPSPALAILRMPEALRDGQMVSLDFNGFSLALDSVRDPGNLGTIIRIAEWFGVSHIFASEDTVDVFNPKTVQASMGSVLRKRVHYTDLRILLPKLTEAGVAVYGTTLENGENIYTKPLHRERSIVVMGSENNGISKDLLQSIPERLYIPPFIARQGVSIPESLNVGVATSIVCYEFRRPAL